MARPWPPGMVMAVLLVVSVLAPGCLQEGGQDGDGDGLPPEGTTEGFRLFDLPFTDHGGRPGSLRGIDADFVIVHVVAPSADPFMPQFAQVEIVLGMYANVTVEALTLRETELFKGGSVADLRSAAGADWTFAHPGGDLRDALSLVRYPTVLLLDADHVVLVRSDDPLGQGRMSQAIEATWGIEPREDAMPAVGEAAPELVWRDVEGRAGSLTDLRGAPVLVNVWEYECPFCLELFNELREVHGNLSARGLEVVSLDLITWETEELVRSVAATYNATWTFAVDGDNIQSRYDIWRLPLLLLLDADGVVRWSHTGYVHHSVIAGEVEKLI